MGFVALAATMAFTAAAQISTFTEQEIEEWRVAAEQGDASAQYNLGAYSLDFGDPHEGMYWLRKAAEQGNAWAQYDFRQLSTRTAKALPRISVMAVRWFRKAADQLHPEVQIEVATAYWPWRRHRQRSARSGALVSQGCGAEE